MFLANHYKTLNLYYTYFISVIFFLKDFFSSCDQICSFLEWNKKHHFFFFFVQWTMFVEIWLASYMRYDLLYILDVSLLPYFFIFPSNSWSLSNPRYCLSAMLVWFFNSLLNGDDEYSNLLIIAVFSVSPFPDKMFSSVKNWYLTFLMTAPKS